MSVRILNGDCLTELPKLAAEGFQAHCVVTDPPYEIGFMGKSWDASGVANRPETWRAVFDCMLPGAHLLAFGGTRTAHRMACAIEDAGFEIRDTIMWVYGSGFPKSLDVSKAIDKAVYAAPLFDEIRAHIRQWRDAKGWSNADLNKAIGSAANGCGMARHWTSENGGQHAIPSKDQWRNLKAVLCWPNCSLDAVYDAVKDGAQRPVVGSHAETSSPGGLGGGRFSFNSRDITAPATPEAAQWQGWGTALKPAMEMICVARKPLSKGTVAANVLAFGTGALNIDASRVQTEGDVTAQRPYVIKGLWEQDHSLCSSCAGHADSSEKHAAPATRASTATRHVEPISNGRAGDVQPDTSRADTGCSAGTIAGDTAISSNIGACGKASTDQYPLDTISTTSTATNRTTESKTCAVCGGSITPKNTLSTNQTMSAERQTPSAPGNTAPAGRWPSNLIHDGSEEVEAAFAAYGESKSTGGGRKNGDKFGGGYAAVGKDQIGFGDTGTASRFFFCAKADATDRAGSRHPTVKPTALMRYLVQLVCPPGGTVLDPFAGSGSTGLAADQLGFDAVLIERDPTYAADAERKIKQDAPLFSQPMPDLDRAYDRTADLFREAAE